MSEADMKLREEGGLLELVNSINKMSFLTPKEISTVSAQNQKNSENSSSVSKAAKGTIEWTDKRQGIVLAEKTQSGGILLGITAKAAGFVIGPHGSSIRDICMKSNVWSTSWLAHFNLSEDDTQPALPLRMIIIEGLFGAIQLTVSIIQKAVERYTALVQGTVPDLMQKVSSEQIIDGIKFEYKPPPLTEMSKAVRTTRMDSNKRKMLASKSSGKFSSACSDSSYSPEVSMDGYTPRTRYSPTQMVGTTPYPPYYAPYQTPYLVYQSPRQGVPQESPYWIVEYPSFPSAEYVQDVRNVENMYPTSPYMYY
eukprot:TRINITY_DN604_c2_g1_i5.p1 TRINITY_DN604_c2_g1~~TRINITY_DN604_c2_g1_i5.p1  ORF type:complete len:310 (+),score=37.06 TRINITY_DN604_c2_g1_i5:148-1077(+)